MTCVARMRQHRLIWAVSSRYRVHQRPLKRSRNVVDVSKKLPHQEVAVVATTSFLNKKHVHSPPNGKAQRCTQHLRCQRQLVGIPCCPQTDFEAHWSHTTLLVTLTVFLLMILHENFSTYDPINARDGCQVSIF